MSRLVVASALAFAGWVPASAGASPPLAAAVGEASGDEHVEAAHRAFRAQETVPVERTPERLPRSAMDPRWRSVPSTVVELAAQRTVLLVDRDANAHRYDRPVQADVRALADRKRLALHVSWPDPTHDRAAYLGTRSFGDAIAIQIPVEFGAGKRLPYIGMGDPDVHVLVSIARAVLTDADGKEGLRARTYVGAGFGSLTRAPVRWMKMDLQYDAQERRWNALFVRPWKTRDHGIARRLVPFAIAVWDGHRHQRGGNKFHSRWKFLRDARRKGEPAYEEELCYGFHPGDVGDPARGKELVVLCAGCHRFPGHELAPPQLAPELSNIGVISTYGYLRDSIVAPSQIIVPVLNLNRHYDKDGEPDRFGAHPHNLVYQWYAEGEDGERVSRMPHFEDIDEAQIADLIAYLKTLGTAEGK